MTQRATSKGKRPVGTRESQAQAAGLTADSSLDVRLAALAAERDAALAELASARAQIAELEAARNKVVDRIDWVVDSLKGIIEAER